MLSSLHRFVTVPAVESEEDADVAQEMVLYLHVLSTCLLHPAKCSGQTLEIIPASSLSVLYHLRSMRQPCQLPLLKIDPESDPVSPLHGHPWSKPSPPSYAMATASQVPPPKQDPSVHPPAIARAVL